MDKVLCSTCATRQPAAQALDLWSVDPCEDCGDSAAGHRVYEVRVMLLTPAEAAQIDRALGA